MFLPPWDYANSLMSMFILFRANEINLTSRISNSPDVFLFLVLSVLQARKLKKDYSKFDGWKIDALFTVPSVKGWINSSSPSLIKLSSSASLASKLEVSSCLPKSILCKNRSTLHATSSISPSFAALPFLGEPRGLNEFGDKQPRGDLFPVQLPLLTFNPSFVGSAATSDPPAPIGGRDCLRGWLSGGRRNWEVGLSGRVGLINARSLKLPTSVFPSEDILRLFAAGERLSTSVRLRGDVVADNNTCGVLYRLGKRGLSLFAPSLVDAESGKDNRLLMLFSTSASSFLIFFFSRSISLPIESLWKSMESSWILSFLSAIEFINIVLSAYSVRWYAILVLLTVKSIRVRLNL